MTTEWMKDQRGNLKIQICLKVNQKEVGGIGPSFSLWGRMPRNSASPACLPQSTAVRKQCENRCESILKLGNTDTNRRE